VQTLPDGDDNEEAIVVFCSDHENLMFVCLENLSSLDLTNSMTSIKRNSSSGSSSCLN
jgi:hypothetical protein